MRHRCPVPRSGPGFTLPLHSLSTAHNRLRLLDSQMQEARDMKEATQS